MASIAKFFPVTDAEKELILREFGRTKQDVKEDLAILREWLMKQAHMPEITDDSLLEHILIRNKFRMAKTKLKIDNYFTCKFVYADYFDALDPSSEDIIKATNVTFSAYMPKLTPDCKRIHIWRMDATLKAEHFDYKSIARYGSILNETQMIFDYCPRTVSIFDAIGLKMAHSLRFDLDIQAKMFKLYFEAFSGRIAAIHVINISPSAEIGINLLKQLLPEKLRNSVFFHSKLENLHKLIPAEYLPSELGGTEKSLVDLSKELATTFCEEREYILKRNKLATNEKLRIGEPPIQTDMFGVEGTFKKITVD